MTRTVSFVASICAAAALVISGCGGTSTPQMKVEGAVDRPASYDATRLAIVGQITQTVSFTSGTSSQTHTYTGPSLWSLLNDAGFQTNAAVKNDVLNRYVLATGADGYRTVFALGEISPDFGNKAGILAYGETIQGVSGLVDAADGPFRVTAPGDVKGGRYVSNLAKLTVATSGSTVAATVPGVSNTFSVNGAVNKVVTLDLTALQALPVSTVTIGSATYTGVSLWTLLNTVAGIKSDSTVKNATLGMYAVATGSDGYKAMLSLGEIDPGFGNRSALIAYSANGAALGNSGVARLVVPGEVKQGRSVSNLINIEVFNAAAAP